MINWQEIDEALFEGYAEHGWNEETKALLMARFIVERGHGFAFDDFVAGISADERAAARAAEEEDADGDEDDLEPPGPGAGGGGD